MEQQEEKSVQMVVSAVGNHAGLEKGNTPQGRHPEGPAFPKEMRPQACPLTYPGAILPCLLAMESEGKTSVASANVHLQDTH